MTTWDKFYKEKITQIFTDKKSVIDIGGGLRVLKNQGNKYEKKNKWIVPLLEKVDYKILDPVADFNPDIVGDIHDLHFGDDTQEAVICNAVLEHVEDPAKASSEMYRVLKQGGYLFVYVPFLYYYHAERGYYKDYWRFTEDSLRYMFKDFSHFEIQGVRGAFETWIYISPLGRYKALTTIAGFLDKVFKKNKSKQVSGHYLFLIK